MSDYFRFAPLVIILMGNQLLHMHVGINGMHTTGFAMLRSYKASLYTVRLNAVDDEMLPFPVMSAMLKMREHSCLHYHTGEPKM